MPHPVTGVDHLFLLVGNLDRSRSQFERLGFTLSPRGVHGARKGTANHTIMFTGPYLELLGVVAATPENAARRMRLARDGEGLHAVACEVEGVETAAGELSTLGIGTGDLANFERPVPLPDGSSGIASFSTLQFAADEVPFGIAFMCEHRSRDMVWRPELTNHANTAHALGGAVAGSGDPEATARRYARLFRAGEVVCINGAWEVRTGNVPLTFLIWTALAERFPGLDLAMTARNAFAALQVQVRNLGAARECLDKAGVRMRRTGAGLAVHPGDVSGLIVEFVENE